MNTRKKALKLYIYILILCSIAAITGGISALLETGVVRVLFATVAIIIFFCGIAQFMLYRYFYRDKVSVVLKEAREEDFPKTPSQETFPRD